MKISVPGSVMLMGEHAVLHSKMAIIAALDYRITVELRPRDDNKITIVSEFGNHQTTTEALAVVAPHEFLLTALSNWRNTLPSGCDIVIESTIPKQTGCGSSTALCVAIIGLLHRWIAGENASKQVIFHDTKALVRSVQAYASGADIAASISGGVVCYQDNEDFDLSVTPLTQSPPLSMIYSGKKVPTKHVVDHVRSLQKNNEAFFGDMFTAMDTLTLQGAEAIELQDWQRFGALCNFYHGLLNTIGVSTYVLEMLVHKLRACPTIHGAKISGSGLGDCVIGIGHGEDVLDEAMEKENMAIIPFTHAKEGLVYL